MTSAVRPKPKPKTKTTTKAAPTSRPARSSRTTAAAPAPTSSPRAQPASAVKQLELADFLNKCAVIEIVIAEVGSGNYEVHLMVAWRYGRSVLTTSSGHPRTFRSLDTLTAYLKTLNIGSTLVRLELLT